MYFHTFPICIGSARTELRQTQIHTQIYSCIHFARCLEIFPMSGNWSHSSILNSTRNVILLLKIDDASYICKQPFLFSFNFNFYFRINSAHSKLSSIRREKKVTQHTCIPVESLGRCMCVKIIVEYFERSSGWLPMIVVVVFFLSFWIEILFTVIFPFLTSIFDLKRHLHINLVQQFQIIRCFWFLYSVCLW